MTGKGVSRRRRALAGLLWGFVLAVAWQAGLSAVLETRPGLRDPEYGRREQHLRERMAEFHGRPVAVVLGSSRVALGVRPGTLPPPGPGEPVIFNMGVLGGGPRVQLVYLRRLLAAGIRPDRVYVEFWPPFADPGEDGRFAVERFNHSDIGTLAAYSPDPTGLRRRWLVTRAVPWSQCRFLLVSQAIPDWLPWSVRKDGTWGNLDGWGWARHPDPDPADRPSRVEFGRKFFAPRLADMLADPDADRALRDLICLCRSQGIAVKLVVLPEPSEIRSWYGEGSLCRFDAWLADLSARAESAPVDARTWCPDVQFMDAVHLTPEGATAFTARFAALVRSECQGAGK